MNAPEIASLHATIRGRVQGVNFRSFVVTRARFLGLTGYARNLTGGSVEVFAEGQRADLEHLGAGPRSARVDSVETVWSEASGEYSGFGIGR